MFFRDIQYIITALKTKKKKIKVTAYDHIFFVRPDVWPQKF